MISITLLLCDAAQTYEGKLSILGGGWTIIKVQSPFAVAAIVDIPWDKSNTKLKTKLELLDEDGNSFAPDGENPLVIFADLEVGRPIGQTPGSSQRIPLAFNFTPILNKVGRFTFQLSVEDSTQSTSFAVV